MGKPELSKADRETTKQLVSVFLEAKERGNFALANDIINDFAYGDDKGLKANPVQAFVLLKDKARMFKQGNPELDHTLCFMAELIGDEDVNRGNRALLQSLYTQDSGIDLIERIANGNFKTLCEDKSGNPYLSQGFDEFEPEDAARIIAYARHALAEFKSNPPPPEPDDLSH